MEYTSYSLFASQTILQKIEILSLSFKLNFIMSLNIDCSEYTKYINHVEFYKNPLPIFYEDFEEFFKKNPFDSNLENLKKWADKIRGHTYPIRPVNPLEPLIDDAGNLIKTSPNTDFHKFMIKKIKERLTRKEKIIDILKWNPSYSGGMKPLTSIPISLPGVNSPRTIKDAKPMRDIVMKKPGIKIESASDLRVQNGFMR